MSLDRKIDVSALALEATLTAMKGTGWSTETLKLIKDTISALHNLAVTDMLSDSTPFVGANIALIKTETDKIAAIKTETDQLPNWRFSERLATNPAVENVASADATNLVASTIIPTFPTGATRQSAILTAYLSASNQAATSHAIGLKIQCSKAGAAYTTILDLTTITPLTLPAIGGEFIQFVAVLGVTSLVDTSLASYQFRWVVDSNSAGSINYTSNFDLQIIYSM